jgi:release factor glutamine methyltransferase
MTIRNLILQAPAKLRNSLTAKLDAELLLMHTIGKPREYLFIHSDSKLSDTHLSNLYRLLERRANGEPIAYIVNQQEFYGRSYYVDKNVLIPRPETEEIVEDAIEYLYDHPEIDTVIDMGTGSGCIATTISIELPNKKVIGLEISREALKIARQNKDNLCPKNRKLTFRESDLFEGLKEKERRKSNIAVISNLPYIGRLKNHYIAEETAKYEPELALFGGEDGLELHRRSWQQIHNMSLDIAWMAMEIGFSQAEQVKKELSGEFPKHKVEIKNDLSGLARSAIIRAKNNQTEDDHI